MTGWAPVTRAAAALGACGLAVTAFSALAQDRLREPRLMLDAVRAGAQVIAVGEWGAVRRSGDGGKRWERVKVPTEETLTAVQFPDPKHGFAVGHHGTVLATDDGGARWVLRSPDPKSAEPLLGVFFFTPQYGFAVGTFGTLNQTDDGARTFHARDIGQGDKHLKAIQGNPHGDVVIASEQGTVFCSSDHGRNFRRVETGYAGSFWGVAFVGDAFLVYGMRGTVYRSTDRCQTWASVPSQTQAGLSAAAVLSPTSVVLAGADGAVLLSMDAGRSFVRAPFQGHETITAAAPVGNGEVLLLGRADPIIFKASNR